MTDEHENTVFCGLLGIDCAIGAIRILKLLECRLKRRYSVVFEVVGPRVETQRWVESMSPVKSVRGLRSVCTGISSVLRSAWCLI